MTAPPFTLDIALVFVVVGVTILLFLTEWLRVDVVAILVMISLPLLGLVQGKDTFVGFSSTAVISIIATIIMVRGLDHTGLVSRMVRPLTRLAGRSRRRTTLLLCVAVSISSSLMQNIGAAALFLPVVQRMSRLTGRPISQMLMPVGFSAILGGTITLVGSSPLLMLNDLMTPFGLKPFDLFDVTPVGLALAAAGIAYFVIFGKGMLPGGETRQTEEIDPDGDPSPFYPGIGNLYELKYPATAEDTLEVGTLCDQFHVHTVGLYRSKSEGKLLPPDRGTRIVPGTTIAVYATPEELRVLAEAHGFLVRPRLRLFAADLNDDLAGLVEAVVPPHSEFVGKSVQDGRFRHRYHMAVMAVSRGGHTHYGFLAKWIMEPGDVILMHGSWESFHRMRPLRQLLFAQSLDYEVLQPHKARIALGCFGLGTGLVAFTSLPISVCLMAGALGMILTGVLSIDDAYRGVDWRTVFLLAGLIPLGLAMQQTGAAQWLAFHMLDIVGSPSPLLFYLLVGIIATGLTLVVSNVGATVLLVPLVIGMAQKIGADPRVASLVVGMAVSNSFLLPTNQVNALYLGPGNYTSLNFVKAGTPLSILFLVVLTLTLHILY
ncbi:SLC13 family permease [Oceanidesulfovibrio marinus]|uniref:SLC13 family permease n=1 Tax=Oceanidesulfovibrio marinus TaxID=370038 RepID=A0A6P1ZI86_9BACT|nr:SLC13 family permease [Oceanidesulfovibrio marinus]QJT08138.1 SLC13 family permease [Oceanidesulfovibrio marinus]TVM35034.1 SLC13 family permease [Oceanidesulfovibrio marinus]